VKPVPIGVVDTGVDSACQTLEGQDVQGVGVRRVGDDYEYVPDFHDLSGHGTAMAARIRSFCPTAQVWAVRIAQQEDGGVTVRVQEQALALGIDWCLNQDIRIINVSYTIAAAPVGGFLDRVCHRAYEEGAIIVAAYSDRDDPVYPAASPTVIGVRRRDNFEPGQVSVLDKENRDLYAWGSSNSIACAQVSAMVGRIHSVDDRYSLEEVFAFLSVVAVP
jgi:subtilisin family serine protease